MTLQGKNEKQRKGDSMPRTKKIMLKDVGCVLTHEEKDEYASFYHEMAMSRVTLYASGTYETKIIGRQYVKNLFINQSFHDAIANEMKKRGWWK